MSDWKADMLQAWKDNELEHCGEHWPAEFCQPMFDDVPSAYRRRRPKGDGWIAWAGGECPIPDAKAGEYEVRWASGTVSELTVYKDAADMFGWCPIGGLRLTAYRLLKPQPAQQPALWYPPQQEGFGPWIEFSGEASPVGMSATVLVLWPCERLASRYSAEPPCEARYRSWRKAAAYCVKLEADKPLTANEVLSRQKPEELDTNTDMVQRDLRPPTQREFGYAIRRMLAPDTVEEAPEAPELLVVAPIGRRVGHGMWGAGRE